MKKRGQLLGMPLVYIFAIIVAGMILLWGGSQIVKYLQFAECVKIQDFNNKLDNDVKSMLRMDTGSRQGYKTSLTSKVNMICFYNSENPINNNHYLVQEYKTVIQNGRKNVYYLPMETEDCDLMFAVSNLRNNEAINPLCFENGKSYDLESKGAIVEVKSP
ncbi:hypothetical protein J4468_01050 [Candidatus Woesearchaeota archaeon]|nr:hypothetical protein [Candidatus Woesearchaeota archaeon]